MRPLAIRRPVLVFAIMTWLLSMSAASAQSAVDPQSLVGEWQGSWKGRVDSSERSGSYFLIVERVDAGVVSLRVLRVTGKATDERSIKGKLTGNVLTYGPVTLTIENNTMRGKSSAGRGSEIELRKK
jgi:hypothetical protein